MPLDGLEPVTKLLREAVPRRRAQKLPIVPVVHDHGYDRELLEQVARWLKSSKVPFTHVVLNVGEDVGTDTDEDVHPITESDVTAVLEILKQVAKELEQGPGGGYRLPRFHDIEWLMSLSIAPDVSMPIPERRKTLGTMMRNRVFGTAESAALRAEGSLKWLIAVALMVTGVRLWLWIRRSGRIPLISGRYRWFFHNQDFMAPRMGADFIELADRLTADRRGGEDQQQVLLLMVHAFLEDLRAAFRLGGTFRRYRVVHAIVLISAVTRANGGYRLLQAINSVRNQTGLLDPLLLITSSKKIPPRAIDPANAPSLSGPDKVDPLQPWSTELPDRWRRQDANAWYLSIPISEHEPRSADARPPALTVAKPRILRQRRIHALLAVSLLMMGAGMYWWYGNNHDSRTCGDGFTWFAFEPRETSSMRIDGECVGITDGSNGNVIPNSPLFNAAKDKITELNAEVERRHGTEPGRPTVTLVFLAALTPSTGSTDQLPAEAEQLAGLAVAQKQQLDKSQESDPLVKLLIANAGRNARHGEWVTNKIGEMAARDPSIIAAIGLNESRATTIDMIRNLTKLGLPVVAATLSADTLADENRMYYQVSPQNRRQAMVSARYAADLRSTGLRINEHPLDSRVRIYYSNDEHDIYSQNLAADLHEEFTAVGFAVESATFTPTGGTVAGVRDTVPVTRHLGESKEAGRDACSFRGGLVFYVGRPLPDFQGFLSGVSDQCRDDPPLIIAGDDATRYVANDQARNGNRSVPFKYVSFAVAPQLVNGRAPAEAVDFYTALESLFPNTRNTVALDGHAALTYDAAKTVITAVGYLSRPDARIQVTGGALWAMLPSVTNADGSNHRYLGVTGEIDFGGLTGQRVPLNKPIAILEVRDGKPHAGDGAYCGSPTDDRTRSWCPFDRR